MPDMMLIMEEGGSLTVIPTDINETRDIQDIHAEAKKAAKDAIAAFLQDWKEKTGGNQYGEPLYCGFVWVEARVKRTNSKEAKALASIGFRKSYRPRIMELRNPADYSGQSMDCKEIGATAYAKVLKHYGFNIWMNSRAD